MKTLKRLFWHTFLCVFGLLSLQTVVAQTTCNTATVVQMNSQNTYQITGNEYWFRFTATTDANASSACEFTINTSSIGIDAIIDSLDREEVFGEVIRDENFYNDLEEAFDFYDNIYLFQYMIDDESLMFMGSTEDRDYQNYFDSLQNTIIGDFAEIDSLIVAGNIEAAIELNDELPEDEDFYLNRKQANSIYFSSFAVGDYNLSESDSTDLMNIALQLPYPGGDGVYVARAMLGIDAEDYGVSYRIKKPENGTSTSLSVPNIIIYPNPTQEKITIEFKEDIEINNAKIEVYNNIGGKIKDINLNGDSNIEIVSLSGLRNGIYFIKISNNNIYIDSFKLIKL